MLTAVLYPDSSSASTEGTPHSARHFLSNQHRGQLTQPPAARQQIASRHCQSGSTEEERQLSQNTKTLLETLTTLFFPTQNAQDCIGSWIHSKELKNLMCVPHRLFYYMWYGTYHISKHPRKVNSSILKAGSGPNHPL